MAGAEPSAAAPLSTKSGPADTLNAPDHRTTTLVLQPDLKFGLVAVGPDLKTINVTLAFKDLRNRDR